MQVEFVLSARTFLCACGAATRPSLTGRYNVACRDKWRELQHPATRRRSGAGQWTGLLAHCRAAAAGEFTLAETPHVFSARTCGPRAAQLLKTRSCSGWSWLTTKTRTY